MPQNLDFYVPVIDNFGDMGFALNLAFALQPDIKIRFFSEDRMLFNRLSQGLSVDFIEYIDLADLESHTPSERIFSFFDRPIPEAYLSRYPFPKTIVQFGYFLLHAGVESLHRTTYLLANGHDRVIHCIPSLLPDTGGVIINPEIERKKQEFSKLSKIETRRAFLLNRHPELVSGSTSFRKNMEDSEINSEWRSSGICKKPWISVFVYPETLAVISEQFIQSDAILFVFASWETSRREGNIVYMPFLSLEDYGVFLSLCDANIVRGENSLCQSLLSGKPTLWDIYKEKNGAHRAKIEDYLGFLALQFPDTDWTQYARIMREFNNLGTRWQALLDFNAGYGEYEDVFKEIREYVRGECDLVKKLEKILEV